MTGADVLVGALADAGVSVCFANPGTSEMHLVAALDREPRIQSVLCLFEGVATGAADGFVRIAGKPAMTLLHLGPGLGNGWANLHNARRAMSPIVNVVGDHATDHRQLDAPLTSDIQSLAETACVWTRTVPSLDDLGPFTQAAFEAALTKKGPVALIAPANVAWAEATNYNLDPARSQRSPSLQPPVTEALQRILMAKQPIVLLGGDALGEAGLAAAHRISLSTGARVFTETFFARQSRGGDRFQPARLPYFAEDACAALAGCDLLIVAGTEAPVAFFAYPDRPSELTPAGCDIFSISGKGQPAALALTSLADILNGIGRSVSQITANPAAPAGPTAGPLTAFAVGHSIARLMPAGTIISDDAVTAGGGVFAATAAAKQHEWLCLTGGAIGQGIPLALGAALAAPQEKVLALSGDGAALYTAQALWSLVREALDVCVIIFSNRAYRILDIEFARTGAGKTDGAHPLLSLDNPPISWVGLAQSLGLNACHCASAEAFEVAFELAMSKRGPMLIEAQISE